MNSLLSNQSRILTSLFALAYAGLFLSIPASNATIALLLLYCLVTTPLREVVDSFRNNPLPKLISAFLLLMVIGLAYTTNMEAGYFAFEKKASLFLLPVLALPAFRRTDVRKNVLLVIGVISVVSSAFLLLAGAYKLLVLENQNAFYFEVFTEPLIPYVYYALYFAIGMLCLIDSVLDRWLERRWGLPALLGMFAYSLGFLILVASKTGILAFTVVSIYFLYRRVNRKLFALSLGALFIVGSSVLYFNDTTRGRFTELTENLSILTRDNLGNWQEERITGLNMRLLFWRLSVTHLVGDGQVFWGTGTGDTQDYLNALWTDPRYQREGYVGWDTHNQWIFTLVQLGLLGVSVWALLYFLYLKMALIRGDVPFLVFLLVTFAFSCSESILESNKGIVYFALLFTLFASGYTKDKPVITN